MKKRSGFTLIELSIVMTILLMVFAALFMVINVGNLSHSLNVEQIRLYEKAREAMRWISRDVRQTTAAEIMGNDYSDSELTFRIYAGFDSGAPQWSGATIVYQYDAGSGQLTRTDNNSGLVLVFEDIVAAPFDVSELGSNIVNVTVSLQSAVRNRQVNADLNSEIKIRNE